MTRVRCLAWCGLFVLAAGCGKHLVPCEAVSRNTSAAHLAQLYQKYDVPLFVQENVVYACGCERRDRGAESERRNRAGNADARRLGGSAEMRSSGGDIEGRRTGSDREARTFGGDADRRSLGSDSERRRHGGDASEFFCYRAADCAGFRIESVAHAQIKAYERGKYSKLRDTCFE